MIKKIFIMSVLPIFILLVGCNKLTQENYNKLSVGMNRAKVEQIFGKPDSCQNVMMATNCTWTNKEANLQVQFVDNDVITYFSKNIK